MSQITPEDIKRQSVAFASAILGGMDKEKLGELYDQFAETGKPEPALRPLLWKIAGNIRDALKVASEMKPEDPRPWEMLDEPWFDYLEELLEVKEP